MQLGQSEQTAKENTKQKTCFFCRHRKAEYSVPLLLQGFTARSLDLIGGVDVCVCKNCHAKQEASLMKKADSSKTIAYVIFAIIAVLLVGSTLAGGTSLFLAIGCSIGAAQAAFLCLKSANKITNALSLKNGSPEKFFKMFDDIQIKNKTIAQDIVIFDFELLKKCIANDEAVSREKISQEISMDSYSSCKFITIDSPVALANLNGNIETAVRKLMRTNE